MSEDATVVFVVVTALTAPVFVYWPSTATPVALYSHTSPGSSLPFRFASPLT